MKNNEIIFVVNKYLFLYLCFFTPLQASSLVVAPLQITDLEQYQQLVDQETEISVKEVKQEWSNAIFGLRFRPYDLIAFDPLSAFGTTQNPGNGEPDETNFEEAAEQVEDTMPTVFTR